MTDGPEEYVKGCCGVTVVAEHGHVSVREVLGLP